MSTVASLAVAAPAARADAAAGKAAFKQACAECHQAADFEGEDPAALQATIRKIVSGSLKHKKTLALSDAQIVDVAAYMTGGS